MFHRHSDSLTLTCRIDIAESRVKELEEEMRRMKEEGQIMKEKVQKLESTLRLKELEPSHGLMLEKQRAALVEQKFELQEDEYQRIRALLAKSHAIEQRCNSSAGGFVANHDV